MFSTPLKKRVKNVFFLRCFIRFVVFRVFSQPCSNFKLKLSTLCISLHHKHLRICQRLMWQGSTSATWSHSVIMWDGRFKDQAGPLEYTVSVRRSCRVCYCEFQIQSLVFFVFLQLHSILIKGRVSVRGLRSSKCASLHF